MKATGVMAKEACGDTPVSYRLYRAEQVRELDRIAIEEFCIPGLTLMERAGQAAWSIIQRHWPRAERIAVFCGKGNNGGDGYVIATLAHRAGLAVQVFRVVGEDELSGDALTVARQARMSGVPMEDLSSLQAEPDLSAFDVIVDALLGTGIKGFVRNEFQGPIELINNADVPVCAVDIPSGLDADTGAQLGMAVEADLTVTFIGMKRGLLTGRGPALAGQVFFDDLQVPEDIYKKVPPCAVRLDPGLVASLLPPRPRDAHKGRFGHVLVIGGDYGMAGAALMASAAAARVGAGLVSVATRSVHVPAFVSRCPEVMAHGVEDPEQLESLLARASVLVIGPGLGRYRWGRSLLLAALATQLPAVVDADALQLLSRDRLKGVENEQWQPLRYRDNWVLTPHPGEAGTLVGSDSAAVQLDRFEAIETIQKRYGGTVILKGAGTLVRGDDPCTSVAVVGNPGMASGGMGDILSGLVGGLLAQSLSPRQAAEVGVLVHGLAADQCAAEYGERGMMATDLLPYVRKQVNPLSSES